MNAVVCLLKHQNRASNLSIYVPADLVLIVTVKNSSNIKLVIRKNLPNAVLALVKITLNSTYTAVVLRDIFRNYKFYNVLHKIKIDYY